MQYLKRSYLRVTYYFSWRYPRLSTWIRPIIFPVQVIALCAGLYAFVDYYQQNFSFEASMRQHRLQLSATSQNSLKSTEVIQHNDVSLSSTPDDALRDRLLVAEQSLRAEILKAEQALIEKKRETQALQLKVLRAKQLLKDEARTLEHLKMIESQI